ncbi:hypothetical protein [Gilvibacter sediminis]|uniref:hypothetical protein n=1 Tax=Gilvibacter sediminis TaxID=379071 RepID=UPI00234FDEED|nr:hypothetical protein [Gilvibacter sediminis]MDC7997272.1 hypothetical protein [Gilvibacter sediminis]
MVLSDKANQYLLVALKLIILVAMGLFLYQKLFADNSGKLQQLWSHLNSKLQLWTLGLWILLSFMNWALEARKWQLLTFTTKPISYVLAWKQTYASLAASLLTPQRIGEYGAKALFFEPSKRKRILWLTFLGNMQQMGVTLLLGIPAILWISFRFELPVSKLNVILILIVLVLLMVFGYLIRKRQLLFQGLSLSALWRKTLELPRIILSWTVIHSLLRYLCFGSLMLWMLIGFGAQPNLSALIPLLFAYYLLSSITPMLLVLDIVVKSGIAVALFGLVGVDELTVVMAVLMGWILNFGIPALIGSGVIAAYKRKNA